MPGTYALTTLAKAQQFLGLSGEGALVDALIDRATTEIERFCQRQFLSRSYASWLDGSGGPYLFVPNPPITVLARACSSLRDAMQVVNSSPDCAYATVRVSTTGITLAVGGGSNAGTTTLLFADYPTLALLAAAVNSYGFGWTATVTPTFDSYPSTELRPIPGRSALTATWLPIPDCPDDEVEIAENANALYRPGLWPEGSANIYVEYTGGYAAIPSDLEEACLELVKQLLDAREADANLLSESLGGHSITMRSAVEVRNDLIARLHPWRRMVL